MEQQRNLLENAPTDWDRRLSCVMIEEMRSWQMCALLVDHFGYSGKVEAQKMLERRAFENKRLLGAFNVDVDNWMDFFTYTDFVDRDEEIPAADVEIFPPSSRSGVRCLICCAKKRSTWARAMTVCGALWKPRRIPAWLIQKYLNKWISSSYDLFGTDHSSSAHWAYVWGVKGRYDEPRTRRHADLDDLNDYNRNLYRDEVAGLIERFNGSLKTGEPRLYAPNIKFNRAIGRGYSQKFHAQTGEPIDDRAYEEHLKDYMPSSEDKKLLLEIIANEKKWIAEKTGARDPLASIGGEEVGDQPVNTSPP